MRDYNPELCKNIVKIHSGKINLRFQTAYLSGDTVCPPLKTANVHGKYF